MKIPEISRPQSWTTLFGMAYGAACVVALPLYMKNGYVGLIGGKFSLLLGLGIVGIIGVVALLLLREPLQQRRFRESGAIWLLGLCACYGIATYMQENKYTALWGLFGRNNGLLSLVACTVIFLVMRFCLDQKSAYFLQQSIVISATLVAGLGWLNYWNIDPFNVYFSMPAEDAHMFLSTIGNINFFGGFLCLCIPILVARAIKSGTRFHFVCAVVAISALVPANSDGSWIAAGVCFLVFLCRQDTTYKECAALFRLMAASCAVWVFNGVRGMLLPVHSPLRTISAIMGFLPVCLLGAILCLGIAFLLEKRQLPLRKIGIGLSIATMVLLLVGVVFFTVTKVSFLGLESLLRLDQTWGSNRGYLWYILMLVYGRLSPLEKLFGAGGDSIYSLLNPHYTQYIIALNGSTFDSAHNEFLQHLVCGGLVGVGCWIAFLVGRIAKGWKHYPEVSLGLLAYGVQSFFSISTPGVLPVVFLMGALATIKPQEQKIESQEKAMAVALAVVIGLVAVLVGNLVF